MKSNFALIKENVDELFNELEAALFVLNPKATEITEKIGKWQTNCPHEFENGKCKYCRKSE